MHKGVLQIIGQTMSYTKYTECIDVDQSESNIWQHAALTHDDVHIIEYWQLASLLPIMIHVYSIQ